MAGTGLPELRQQQGARTQPAPLVPADDGAAQAWGQTAAVADRMTDRFAALAAQSEHAAKLKYLTDLDLAAREKQIELRAQYREDPAGFDRAWKGYADGVLGSVDLKYGDFARQKLEENRLSALAPITEAAYAKTKRLAADSVSARLDAAQTDLMGAAYRGGVGDPAFMATANVARATLDDAVNAGLMSKDHADISFNHLMGKAKGEAIVGAAKRIYDQRGAEGAFRFAEEQLRDPALGLSPQEMESMRARVSGEVSKWETFRRTDLAEIRADAAPDEAALRQFVPVARERVADLASRYIAKGGYREAADLWRMWETADRYQGLAQMPLEQLTKEVGRIRGEIIGRASTTGKTLALGDTDIDALTRTAFAEAGNQGQQGLAAVVHTILNRAAHPSWGGTISDVVNARNQFEPVTRAGGDWKNLPAPTEEQRAQVRTLIEGIAAGRETDPTGGATYFLNRKISASRGTDFGHGKDQFKAGEIGDHTFYKPGVFGEKADPVPTYSVTVGGNPSMLSAANKLLADRVRHDWGQVKRDLDQGINPPAATVATVIEGAASLRDPELLHDISLRLGTADAVNRMQGAPLGQLERTRAGLETRSQEQGLPPPDAELLVALRKLEDETRAGLKSDPIGMAVQRGLMPVPPPVDWANEAQARGALRMAQRAAVAVEQHYGLGTQSVFRPDDLAALKATWQKSDSGGRARILGTLAGSLDGEHLRATLEKVAGDDPVFAAAGLIYRQNAPLARSIVEGQKWIDTEKKILPPEEKYRSIVNSYLGSAAGSMPQARAAIVQTALARYADLSASAHDFTGAVSEARLNQALAEVTGGTIPWGQRSGLFGGIGIGEQPKIIAPKPGMTSSDFGRLIDSLTDDDLASARTASGNPLKASSFKTYATLHDHGPGRYLVEIGNGYARTADGQPFVLDLGRKVQ